MTFQRAPIMNIRSFSRRWFMQGASILGMGLFWRNNATGHDYSSTPPYQARFFTSDEYRCIDSASTCILPRDEHGPGAHDLGVAEFIDRQMQTPYGYGALWYRQAPFQSGPPEFGYQLPYTPRQLYRNGLYSLTQHCLQHYQSPFQDLPFNTQNDVLTQLEENSLALDDIPGSTFFEQLRSNTLEGAFSDPLYGGNRHMEGWRMMGFPGARADFMDWINQNGAPYPFGPVSIPSPITTASRD